MRISYRSSDAVLFWSALSLWLCWGVALYLWREEGRKPRWSQSALAWKAFRIDASASVEDAALKSASSPSSSAKAALIAHRGASAYAPEHTEAAYVLAIEPIEQGADYVEQDLQLTKDGALVCSHDAELSRTTNVAEVFPERATLRDPEGKGILKKGWYVVDFTLAEIKRLDAGSWFNRANPFAARKEYAGLRILTFDEAVRLVGNRSRLYVETKYVPFYESLGKDMMGTLAFSLRRLGLSAETSESKSHAGPAGWPRLFIQSFSRASLLRLRELAPEYARIQLLPMEDPERRLDTRQVTADLAAEIAQYASGAGPAKEMLQSAADVNVFHRAGLKVHPYTFRGSTTAIKREALDKLEANGKSLRHNIVEEIRHFLSMGIDGGFTDYPDLWKEAVSGSQTHSPSQP